MPENGEPLRVLVIDDSVDSVEALRDLLEVWGCLTAVAFSGRQGIATAVAFAPHLAVIDLEMPGMGGCEVVRQLRARPSSGNTRYICLTGRTQAGDRRMCLDAGFDDFFTKPMALEQLARQVASSNAARQGVGPRDPRSGMP